MFDSSDDRKSVGLAREFLRKKAGWTQGDLAARATETGIATVTKNKVCRLEAGLPERTDRLLACAKALGVAPELYLRGTVSVQLQACEMATPAAETA